MGEELESSTPRRALGGLLLTLALIAGTLVVYSQRGSWLPGYGGWVKAGTAVVLVIAARSPCTGWYGSSRHAFAGVFLQSTRPFRVGERVRLVGGVLAGSLEGTVSSLGLFYTTLAHGADRIQVPNSVMINLAVVPMREPEKVDLRARFSSDASPRRIEQRLLDSVDIPTRYAPNVALEEVDEEGVVLRISATPLRSGDGSQLAAEVLEALRSQASMSTVRNRKLDYMV